MKICIYGAGAIGGYLGLHLAEAGYGVTLIARGPHLEAMKTNGLKLRINGAERIIHPPNILVYTWFFNELDFREGICPQIDPQISSCFPRSRTPRCRHVGKYRN